jgi:hypothetical protein
MKFFVGNYFGQHVINYLSVCSNFSQLLFLLRWNVNLFTSRRIRYISCCLMSSEQMFNSIRDENKFTNKIYKAKRLILQCINGESSN